MTGRVYFIKPIGMDGPVKIGCSVSPDSRRKTLETWSPFPLEVAAEIEGGYELERRFHGKFIQDHSHREWFKASVELTATIAEIRNGTFSIEALPEPIQLPTRRKGSRAKWTPEQRERNRLQNAVKKAEQVSGLVCDYPHTNEALLAFVSDPSRHGITPAERQANCSRRMAQLYMDKVDKLTAEADKLERAA